MSSPKASSPNVSFPNEPLSAPAPRSRANLWLAAVALVLLGAVISLVVVLLQRDRGAPSKNRLGAAKSVLTAPLSAPGASAGGASGSAAAATGADAADGGAGGGAKPYVNLDDPKNAPLVQGAPGQTAPDPADPLGSVLKGFSAIFDDPDLKKALDGLDKTIKHGSKVFGKIFGGGRSAGLGSPAPSPPPAPGGAAAKPDPLSQLLNQALSLLGGAGSSAGSGSGAGAGSAPRGGGLFGSLFGGGSGSDDRITATVRDDGNSYVVSCRFPLGAPDTATFQVRGEKLVIKARFSGVDEEQEVELPGPVHPMGARSELKNGELIVTLPKVS